MGGLRLPNTEYDNLTLMVFGSSTDVGKTIVSAGISAAALKDKKKVCSSYTYTHIYTYIYKCITYIPLTPLHRRCATSYTYIYIYMYIYMHNIHTSHTSQVCYIKPVQTGDMDEYFVQLYTNPHGNADIYFRTLNHWKTATSPHIAASLEGKGGGLRSDDELLQDLAREISAFEQSTATPPAEGKAPLGGDRHTRLTGTVYVMCIKPTLPVL
jgi:hypothetical protein